jgi:hypothetical protein
VLCPNCQQPLPENAQFCLRCGRPVSTLAGGGSPRPTVTRPHRKWLALGLGLLVLIGLAALIGVQSGLLTQARVKKPTGPSVLEAEAPKPAGPSVLEAEAPKPKQPPQHILNWLEHLRRIEMKRRAMERNFNPALQMLKDALALKLELEEERQQEKMQNLEQGYHRYQQDWAGLLREYRAVPPPAECRVLADTYDSALSSYVTLMLQIEDAMQKQDLNSLMNMRGTAQSDVDQRLINADVELMKVCEAYGVRKYFDIRPSGAMETLFGF